MSERTGICNKCGQRYGDIPDSVTALKVKCQVCAGTVEIPPLPAPAAPTPGEEPAPAESTSPTAAEAPAAAAVAPEDKPLAAPLGEARPKTERPEKAKSIDRDIAAPAPPAAETPAAAKPAQGIPPVKAGKPLAKPVLPVRPIARAKPVQPIRPVAKAAPVKPVAKPAASAQPPTKAAQPKAAPPVETAPAANAQVKSSAAAIIAKAKAKRAAAAQGEAEAAKASPADIIARAKQKRAASESKSAAARASQPAAAKSGGTKHAPSDPHNKSIVGSGTRRPSSSGAQKAATKRARHHREEEYEEKSKSPMIIAGVVLLALIGAGSWYFLRSGDQARKQGETANVPDDAGVASGANNTAPEAADVAPSTPEAVDVAPISSNPVDDATSGSENTDGASAQNISEPAADTPAPVVAGPGADWVAAAVGEPISTRGVTNYRLIKLDQVPPLAKFSGSSDAEWTSIMEDLALFLDDSGAQSNRAGKRLVEDYPRGAYPAIVNALMKLDYEDSDDLYMATTLNNLLTTIGKGTNLGWDSVSGKEQGSQEWDKAVLWNKKVVASWQALWINKYAEDDAAWASFSSSAEAVKTAEDAAKKTGGVVGPEEDPFD